MQPTAELGIAAWTPFIEAISNERYIHIQHFWNVCNCTQVHKHIAQLWIRSLVYTFKAARFERVWMVSTCVYCSDCNVHAWQTLIKMEHVYKIQPDLICICPLLAQYHHLCNTHAYFKISKSSIHHIIYITIHTTRYNTTFYWNNYVYDTYFEYSLQKYPFSGNTV